MWPIALPPSALVGVCPLAARRWRALAPEFSGCLRGMPARSALSFVLLVSRSCAVDAGLRSVSVQMTFGGPVYSGLCYVWLLLFSVPVGL
jgi:hypothetical protein